MSRLMTALLCALTMPLAFVSGADARPTLTAGDRGTDVRHLRAQLHHLGYLPSPGPAVYDPATAHAITAYQKVRGLARDGVAGPVTRRALRRSATAGARPRPRLRSSGRGIEIDLSQQVAKLIRDGRTVRTIAISSGAPGYNTPLGRHRVQRQERMSWSVPYRTWLPYASYFIGGVALHAYPSVPPVAASHGCVRVPAPFAAEVYAFARVGTPVAVLP